MQFNVISYSVQPNVIQVSLEREMKFLNISIPRDEFEFFLLLESKLIWIIEHSDKATYSEELEGTMSYDEYWKLDKEVHCSDLYDYIIANKICYHGIVYSQNTKSILNHFNQK